jgi:hypothetical protein
MYGYSVEKKGILTDNYYKEIGKYIKPEPQGVYVMVRKKGNKIFINQDFHGNYGIYIYKNKDTNYFAISNSFLLLEKYLIDKENLTFNKDFADNFIISSSVSLSLDETLIKEIKQIPNNSFIVIDIKTRQIKIYNIDYKENTIPLESVEGLKIIDDWADKWGFIFRSLNHKTNNFLIDLSGGFDTRMVLSLFINSGININDSNIFSTKAKSHDHDIDLIIAKNISSNLGFKINDLNIDNNGTNINKKISIYNTFYSKLGFHKEFYLKTIFYKKPRFVFSGNCGETLRGMPCLKINEFIKRLSSIKIFGHEEEFYNSSMRILNRSISILKSGKKYMNDYEISYDLYSKSVGRNHCGKGALERFITNTYTLHPLMDPEIKKIKYKMDNISDYLMAYIYIRFAKELINFPFQGNRSINLESIKKAEKLNNEYIPYEIKADYNKKFYIDCKKKITNYSLVDNENPEDGYQYLKKLIRSSKYEKLLNKVYDNKVFDWANEHAQKSNYHPLRHHYALLAIAKTLEILSMNKSL